MRPHISGSPLAPHVLDRPAHGMPPEVNGEVKKGSDHPPHSRTMAVNRFANPTYGLYHLFRLPPPLRSEELIPGSFGGPLVVTVWLPALFKLAGVGAQRLKVPLGFTTGSSVAL